MNPFEVLVDTIKPFLDGKKPPLHVGEVMNLWFYLTGTQQTLRFDQMAYNIVQDPDFKEKLQDVINNVHRPMIQELEDFLKKEGVPLPSTTPEKTLVEYMNIPEGARLTDEELANFLAYDLVIGIMGAARGITEAIRPDVSMMFLKYQIKKITFSITFKDLLQKRGWLKVPPYYPSTSTN
jgi:hypothetical protein